MPVPRGRGVTRQLQERGVWGRLRLHRAPPQHTKVVKDP